MHAKDGVGILQMENQTAVRRHVESVLVSKFFITVLFACLLYSQQAIGAITVWVGDLNHVSIVESNLSLVEIEKRKTMVRRLERKLLSKIHTKAELEVRFGPSKKWVIDDMDDLVRAHFGQTDAVKLLINKGAQIDGIRGQMTPLQCAVYSGHHDTVTFLLTKNADPNLTDKYGISSLAIAARKGDAKMVEALLKAGANIEHADDNGWRPLHSALRSTGISDAARLATVAVLLEHGADPNATNVGGFERDSEHDSHLGPRTTNPNVGNTPVAIAKSNGFNEIVTELIANGGI